MLKDVNKNARDIIEEECIMLFNEKKMTKPEKAVVKESKFVKWWSEGKLDNFETIKYYLIDVIRKMALAKIESKEFNKEHLDRFDSYYTKHKEIKILKEHYEDNFSLLI
jgi:hypothetical protein